jgi:hypothetical protein
MNGQELYAVRLRDVSYTYIPVPATAGAITIDYKAALFQLVTPTGPVSISITNWPAAGTVGSIRIGFNITDPAYTVTLPQVVNTGLLGIQGISPGTPNELNTINFGRTGQFAFEFASNDGGQNIWIFDESRPIDVFTDRVLITKDTAATSTTTGALIVSGGVGVAGNLHVGGNIVGNIQINGINVPGTITGDVLVGNSAVVTSIAVNELASGDSAPIVVVDSLDVQNNIQVSGDITVTGNVIGDITGNVIGDITGNVIGDITGNVLTGNIGNINELTVQGDITVAGNISPATDVRIGGVRAGPGANISNTGLLTIDTSGLSFSFGNFTANTNILTMINNDENMVLATSGNAEIQLVGDIGLYRSNGLPPDVANRYFYAQDTGTIQILVTSTNNDGAVQIIGSATGNTIAPGITGAMLHVTGQFDTPCRLYYDGDSDYVSWVARRWNGNVDAPTQVLAGDDVLRINSTAATDAGVGNVAMAQIRTTALENQTTTAQGSSITFTVTPVGSPASARVDVANVSVANGVSATKLTSSNPTGGIGYIAGAGGTVTQATSKITPVTLNTISGEITMHNAQLAGGAAATFTLTNSAIANADVMIINHVSGGTLNRYAFAPVCNNGSANITVTNITNSAESAALILRYVVIKGAVA